jgi:hypothetical protein
MIKRPEQKKIPSTVRLRQTDEQQTQEPEQERKMATLKARAERGHLAEAEVRKLKAENEKLQADLDSKSQKARNNESRVSDMANRLLQADKKSKSLEGKNKQLNTELTRANKKISELSEVVQITVPALEQRNRDLETALQAASKTPSSTPQMSTKLSELIAENEDLREELEINKAGLEAGCRDLEYELELFTANTNINAQFTAVVSELSAKDSKITNLTVELEKAQEKYDELKGKADLETVERRAQHWQDECKRLQTELDQTKSYKPNIFNKLTKKQQTHEPNHNIPRVSAEPNLQPSPDSGIFIKPADPPPNQLAAPETPLQPSSPFRTTPPTNTPLPTPLHITITITAADKRNLTLLKRLQAALRPHKKSTLNFQGPPILVKSLFREMEALEQDHATQCARVVELRAALQSQVLQMERLKADAKQRGGRSCSVPGHRFLADELAAMRDRLEMQDMLLAYGSVRGERGREEDEKEAGEGKKYGLEGLVGGGLVVPTDEGLWA